MVHDGEDGLLDFTSVMRPSDDDQPPVQSQDYERIGMGAVTTWDCFEIRSVKDGELRVVCFQFITLCPDEHIVHEGGVPSLLRHQSDRHSVIRVGSAECVLDEQLVSTV